MPGLCTSCCCSPFPLFSALLYMLYFNTRIMVASLAWLEVCTNKTTCGVGVRCKGLSFDGVNDGVFVTQSKQKKLNQYIIIFYFFCIVLLSYPTFLFHWISGYRVYLGYKVIVNFIPPYNGIEIIQNSPQSPSTTTRTVIEMK